MKISKLFPPAYSQYGAPNGRRNEYPETPKPVRLRLARARMTGCGAYDQGGAYWGSPVSEIHCGWNQAGVRIYARAKSKRDAAAKILKHCPDGSTCGGFVLVNGDAICAATRKAQSAACKKRAAWLDGQIKLKRNTSSTGPDGEIPQPDPELVTIATGRGYAYTHSTPIGLPGGGWRWLHTFHHASGHTVSLCGHAGLWETACGNATGSHWNGKGAAELTAHLKGKAHRYGLKS